MEPRARLASVSARVQAAAQARDHAAVTALLAELRDGYESYAAQPRGDVGLMLQTEAALSATVRLSARSLEARVARAAEDQGAGFLRGQLRLLPRAGAPADPPRVDLRLLADAFQAGYAARFPPELAASLYAGCAAGTAGPAAPRAPPRPREAEPSGAQAVERRRYEALAMCGAELQERRKQGLLARVTELSRRGFYPLAFVFLKLTL